MNQHEPRSRWLAAQKCAEDAAYEERCEHSLEMGHLQSQRQSQSHDINLMSADGSRTCQATCLMAARHSSSPSQGCCKRDRRVLQIRQAAATSARRYPFWTVGACSASSFSACRSGAHGSAEAGSAASRARDPIGTKGTFNEHEKILDY